MVSFDHDVCVVTENTVAAQSTKSDVLACTYLHMHYTRTPIHPRTHHTHVQHSDTHSHTYIYSGAGTHTLSHTLTHPHMITFTFSHTYTLTYTNIFLK